MSADKKKSKLKPTPKGHKKTQVPSDPLLLNKFAAGILLAVLVLMGGSHLLDALFPEAHLEDNAVTIDTSSLEQQTSAGPAEVVIDPIIDLLSSADPIAGEKTFRLCVSCHTIAQNGPDQVGPNLWDILGQNVAANANFKYSKAITKYAEDGAVWDYDNLNRYLFSPLKFFTEGRSNMNFVGIRSTKDRANLIRYLRDQAETPIDLP